MMRKLLYSFLLFFTFFINYAQCPFGSSQFGTTQSIIYNREAVSGTNVGTVTFSNVPVGRYVAVNVIQGLTYTITATSSQSFRKRITFFNQNETNSNVGSALATSDNGAATSTNWLASFTGTLYIRINNNANCSATTGNPSIITVTYTGGSNVELQDREGNNSWIAHVYDFSNSVAVNPLSDANAFTNSSYLGAFTQANTITGTTTSFSQNYGGGNTPSFPFVAGGSSQTFYAETFAVRYKMRSTLTSGCYFVRVRGDDGVRLFVDGVKVFDAWIQQGATDYTNILVYLNGNSQLVLDYYDKDEANITEFSINPAESTINSLNVINTLGPVYRCANGGNTVLDGSAIAYQGSNANPSLKFQWQSSPDNVNWTDIGSATGENYTVASTNPASTTIVYYRRNITGTAVNAASCVYSTESIAVITSRNVAPAVPVLSTATNIFCSQFTANWATVSSASGYYLDVSTNSNFSPMVSGYNNLDVGLVNSYNLTGLNTNTLYYYRLRAYNKCSNNTSASSTVVSTSTVSPVVTISENITICQNASSPNVTFTNPQVLPVTVTYNINGGSNTTINLGASSTANTAVPTTNSGVFVYNLVSVAYQSTPTCSNLISGSATVTINPLHIITAGSNQSVCQNTAMTNITMTLGGGATGATVIGLPAGVTNSVSGNTLTISGTPTVSGQFTYNVTTTGNSCTVATTSGIITVGIGNNIITYANGTSGSICVNAAENNATATDFIAPAGTYFNNVSFASYGTANGNCSSFSLNYTCHAPSSQSTVENALLGNAGTIKILPSNTVFTDPCVGTVKSLKVIANYSQAICPGTTAPVIIGSTPTGSGTYTYSWERSTTGLAGSFSPISGTNSKDHSPGILNQSTWFRRIVTSSGCSNTSAVVLVKVNPRPTSVVSGTTTVCNGISTAVSVALTGTAPWSLTYSDGTATTNVTGITASPYTFNVSPTTNTTYTVTALSDANNCPSIASDRTGSAVITLNSRPTATVSGSTTICRGTSATVSVAFTGTAPWNISYTYGATSGNFSTSLNPYTVDVSPTSTTTYSITALSDANCTALAAGITGNAIITVNPLPTAPTVTKNSDATCESLGRVTLTGLPSGSWTINQTGFASQTLTGTTSSRIISGLAAGTYYFTVTNASNCTSSPVVPITIVNQTSTTIWNGSAWSNGDPDSSKTVIINSAANQPFTASMAACSLTINVPTGASDPNVIIPDGVTLTITNSVTSNGKLIFESGSSLVQTTNAVNTGDIIYKRTTAARRYDFTYWSMPVTKPGFSMYNLSPGTLNDKFQYYDPDAGWSVDFNGTMPMETGKGYNIRAPQSFDLTTPQNFTAVFTGVPNNGDYPVPVASGKWNLIGNPYPSAIDADELMLDNLTLGSLYFWGHEALPVLNPADGKYYYNGDFTVYNSSGATVGGSGLPFQGYIAAAQGFIARPASGTVIFNNDIRLPGSNSQFYKTAKSAGIEKNRVWLNFANTDGVFKQILVGYIQGATNTIDVNYDAVSMGANTFVDFYSINSNKKLTIQGRTLPFEKSDEVPLGYKLSAKGAYTISIDHADGIFDNQDVYLEDKETGKTTNLRLEDYKFTTAEGSFNSRFVIRYTSKTLGTDDFENLQNSVIVSVKDGVVKITSSKEALKEVNIYNVGAQLLYTKNKVNLSELVISNLHSSDQALLVKITLENGHAFTKKIIYSNL